MYIDQSRSRISQILIPDSKVRQTHINACRIYLVRLVVNAQADRENHGMSQCHYCRTKGAASHSNLDENMYSSPGVAPFYMADLIVARTPTQQR